MIASLILASDPVLFNFTLSDLLYVCIAIIIGAIAETIIGWRLPYGVLGAVLCAIVGIVILVALPLNIGQPVPIFGQNIEVAKAFLGGSLLVTIWHLLTYRTWRERTRQYYPGHRRRSYRY